MFKTNFITECPEPPKSNTYNLTYDYSFKEGEYWLDTNVTYTCADDRYRLYPEQNKTLTCGRDGVWNPKTAPDCGLGKISF